MTAATHLRIALLVVGAVPLALAAPVTPPPKPLRAAPVTLPQGPQFAIDQLRVAGRLLSVHVEDVNGDGKRDLLAIYLDGAPPHVQRRIALFLHHGAFHALPDQVLAVPAGASFVDLADLDGDGRSELLFGNAEGLSFIAGGANGFVGAPQRLLAIEGLVLLAAEEDLPFIDVARDWRGDGRPAGAARGTAIVLPLVDRLALITRAEDGHWARTGDLRLPPHAAYALRSDVRDPRARNYWLRAVLTVPELHLADFDGDGHPDLIAVLDDAITVFHGDSAALFAPVPIAIIPLGTRTAAEAERGNAIVQVTVRDFDGDGIADLAVNKVTGGIGAMHAQTGFYYGKKGGGYGRPAQVIARDGFAGALLFADLDGDGRPELVVPHTSVGFGEAVRIVLARRMTLGFEVHENLGEKGFAPAAAIDLPIDLAIDYSVGAELDSPFPNLDGDFNGDGRTDLAAPKGDGLGIFLGGGKSLLAEYPKAIVHLPMSRWLEVVDLDGDRRADVVLFYRFKPDRQGSIVVLRNTGQGW